MAMSRRAKKRILVLVLLVIGAGVALGSAVALRKAGRARALEQARVEGLEAFEQGDYRRATNLIGLYVNTNRDDGEMVLKFVEARRRTPDVNAKHLLTAINFARLAAEKLPGDPRPLEALMSLYGEMRFLTEYLETANRLLAVDPENREALIARVTGLASQGEVTRAIEAAREFAKIHPSDWRAHAAIIDLMRTRGDSPDAVLEYINGVAAAHIEDLNIAIQQSRAAWLARKETESRAAADRAASLRVPDAESLARLVSLLDALGERQRASQIIEREVRSLGESALVVAIDRAWKDGRAREALDFIRNAVEDGDLTDADVNLLGWGAFAGVTSDQQADRDMAERLDAALREREGDDAAGWIALVDAQDALVRDDTVAARERLEFARSLGRNDMAEFLLGQADLRVGDRRGAIARWRGVIEREPRWVAARLALAGALLDDGEVREAHRAAIEALRLAPDRVLVAQVFARTAAALADADMPDPDSTRLAIDALGRIIEGGVMEPGPSLALLARLQAADGDLRGAQATVDRILREKPAMSPSDALALASVIERRGLQGGQALLESSGDIANDPGVLFARAVSSAAQGRADEGRAMLRDALDRAPDAMREPYARAYARFLDAIDDANAIESLRALSADYAASPAAQREVLRSVVAWNDAALVKSSIDRLRAAVGEQSPAWKIFEARRLLTFRPPETSRSGGDPTAANAAEVALMLSPVVRDDPGDAQAASLLAEAHLLLGQRDRAINTLSAAVTANPSEPGLYPRLISLLQEKGDTAAAEQRLIDFLRIRDVTPDVQRARVDLLLAQGMATQALPLLEQLAQSGDPDDLVRLATAYARQGRTQDATRLFEQLETMENPSINSALGVAEYRLARGEPDRALAALDRLPASIPEGRRALLRADLLERAGRIEEAAELFARTAQQENSGDAWLALARHHVRQGNASEAKIAADKAFAVAPNDPSIRSLAKGLALATGQRPAPGLESVEVDETSGAEMRTLVAIQALRDNPKAVDAYLASVRGIVGDFPRYFPARRLLVLAAAERGDWEAAVVEAREAVRVLPLEPQAAQLLAEVYAARAQFDESRGLVESQRQNTESALAAAREWRARSLGDPFDPDVAIADLLDRLDNPREALRTLEPHQARLDAAGLAVAPLRARLYAKTGQVDRAEAVLMPHAETDEAWALTHAETARRLNAPPEAVRAWLARSERYVGSSAQGQLTVGQAWYDLANRTREQGDYLEAVRVLEAVSPEDRAGPGALLLATIYELLGRLEDAERVYRDALAQIPDEPITLNNLSFFLASHGVKLDEAVELARRAVENSERMGFPPGQRVNFLDSFGVALLRAGQHDEAVKAFEKGLSLDPTNRLLMMGLAESLVAGGKPDAARRWISQIEQTAPVRASDDPLRDRLREIRARVGAR